MFGILVWLEQQLSGTKNLCKNLCTTQVLGLAVAAALRKVQTSTDQVSCIHQQV